jgi:hypothetical protein
LLKLQTSTAKPWWQAHFLQATVLLVSRQLSLLLTSLRCARAAAQAATEIAVDSIVMDCEDGVAVNMKDVARGKVAVGA